MLVRISVEANGGMPATMHVRRRVGPYARVAGCTDESIRSRTYGAARGGKKARDRETENERIHLTGSLCRCVVDRACVLGLSRCGCARGCPYASSPFYEVGKCEVRRRAAHDLLACRVLARAWRLGLPSREVGDCASWSWPLDPLWRRGGQRPHLDTFRPDSPSLPTGGVAMERHLLQSGNEHDLAK